MNRPLAGIIALSLLVLGSLLYLFHPSWDDQQALAAGCLRVGAALGAIWVAYPELVRVPPFWAKLGLAIALIIAVRPKLALFLIPLLIVMAIFRPRGPKRA